MVVAAAAMAVVGSGWRVFGGGGGGRGGWPGAVVVAADTAESAQAIRPGCRGPTDARLAKLCLWGRGPVRRPPTLRGPGDVFLGVKN